MKSLFLFWRGKVIEILSTPLFPLVSFFILAIVNLSQPGLYMDSVNPDYLAAYISNPGNIPSWVYSDNALFPEYKYPLLNSLYGGATPAYIGLFLWEIIGYSVFSIRILHLIYGLIIVYLCYKTIYWLTKNRLFASVIALIIGLDPTFLFAWRTQYYLQLFPLITFIPSVVLLTKVILGIKGNGEIRPKTLMLSGFLAGFSAWGYFIYAFYFLTLLAFVIYYSSKQNKVWRVLKLYCFSFLTGYILFIYAHVSIILSQGLDGYITSLKAMNNAYGISENLSSDIPTRVIHVWNLVSGLFGGDFISNIMVGQIPDNFILIEKLIFPVWIVLIIWHHVLEFFIKDYFKTELQHQLSIFVKLITIIVLVHLLLGVIIGTSLNYQHYIMLLSLIYLSGAAVLYSFYLILKDCFINNYSILAGKIICLALIILVPIPFVSYSLNLYNLLGKTGGINYYSDSINRLAEYTIEIPAEAVMAFPQWGYWMGVAAATGGSREIWSESDVDQLINDINNKPYKKDYYVVLEINKAEEEKKKIIDGTDLLLINSITFHTRDGIPTISVVHFERKN